MLISKVVQYGKAARQSSLPVDLVHGYGDLPSKQHSDTLFHTSLEISSPAEAQNEFVEVVVARLVSKVAMVILLVMFWQKRTDVVFQPE